MDKTYGALCKKDDELSFLTQTREENEFNSLEEKILRRSEEILYQINREYDAKKSIGGLKKLSFGFLNKLNKQSLEYKIRSHVQDIEKLIRDDRNINLNMDQFLYDFGLWNILRSSLRVQAKYKELVMKRITNEKNSDTRHRLDLLSLSIFSCQGSRA